MRHARGTLGSTASRAAMPTSIMLSSGSLVVKFCIHIIVTALAIITGLEGGFGSVEFAITFIFAAVVMRDAMGVRLEAGKQAASIIEIATLLNDYFSEHDEHIKTDKLKVLVGHTPFR